MSRASLAFLGAALAASVALTWIQREIAASAASTTGHGIVTATEITPKPDDHSGH